MHIQKLDKYSQFRNNQSFDDGSLGGCNIYGDPASELPKTMGYLIDKFNIKSVADVGGGFGFHSKFFQQVFDLETLCIEGSEKVVELSLVPESVVCHDYTTGPYVPDKTYDLGWSVEFVEHVEDIYKQNFIDTLKKCKYVLMTHAVPGQGGHHHVNERHSSYWIDVMTENGFTFDVETTNNCKKTAGVDFKEMREWLLNEDVDKPYRGPSVENWDTDELRNKFLICHMEKNSLFFQNNNLLS
jgi:hypothetical protein